MSLKTVLTDSGKLELAIPRDRQGRFGPTLIAKYQRRFPGFHQKIIALYARGMSTRDIQAHLREPYGIEISPELVGSDRRRPRRSLGVAGAAAGSGLRDRVLRLSAHQDP